jgi:hypothetical protein
MSRIHVHRNIGQIELRDCVLRALFVGRLRIGALRDV